MIHANKNSKLSEGPQKLPAKSVPQKLHQKTKTLPEKTKFTLQYNSINSQTVKNADKKLQPFALQLSRDLHGLKTNVTASGVQDERGKAFKDQKSTHLSHFKASQLSGERKNSSLQNVRASSTTPTNSKLNVSTTRRLTKIAVKIPTNSKSGLVSSKSQYKASTIPHVQACSHHCKTDTKTQGKTANLRNPTNSQSGLRIKEFEKLSRGVNSGLKKSLTSYKPSSCRVHDGKPEDEARSIIVETAIKKCVEENRKATAKERSRSQEVKRITSKDTTLKFGENTEKKCGEGKILLSGLEKSTSYMGLREKNWETGSPAFHFQEKTPPIDFPSFAPRNASNDCLTVSKRNVNVSQDPGIDVDDFEQSKSKINVVDITHPESKSHDTFFKDYSVDDHLGFESLEKLRRDEELLNLDKRIWSNLEVQIKETCEKTDILCDSGDDSSESTPDSISQFFSNRDDEAFMECFKASDILAETRKYQDYREDWKALSTETKSKHDLRNRVPEKDNVTTETKSKDLCDRPKSRRAIEEALGRKINQESKRTKSIEDSKIKDSKQKFRTKSLSGDLKWTNLREDGHGKSSKERKSVNFLDDYKLDSKCVSSSFFDTHKNLGFIGREVDEECMSFEPGQVTLYQPHESQMLLYDIANCAATEGYLKMCGIAFDVATRKNAEQMSPSGRVPFISSNLCIIPEFEAIVSFMQYKKFACIPVEENDKPAFRTIISMIVDILEMTERYICWYDDTTLLNYTTPRVGGKYPFPLNHIMQWKKKHEEKSRLAERGYSKRSFDLILGEISSCFRTLSRRLGNNNFFFGNIGTEVDALVYGHVYALFTTEVEGPLRDLQFIIKQYPNLISFACNFDKTFSLDKFQSLQLSYWDNILAEGRYPSDASFSVRA